jgi:hypothetical protein
LSVVSSDSSGVEKTLYDDMIKRNIRATTGPDEGIDARSVACYPTCVFVPLDAVNAIGVESWHAVLQHEYHHIIQVQHNPNLAADFRGSNGSFTTYAAFMEACADYGLNVGVELYHAQERIDKLKSIVGRDQESLLEQACNGVKGAYTQLMNSYNNKASNLDAFATLFPPYK